MTENTKAIINITECDTFLADTITIAAERTHTISERVNAAVYAPRKIGIRAEEHIKERQSKSFMIAGRVSDAFSLYSGLPPIPDALRLEVEPIIYLLLS
jgi:hypothetical protein